MQVGDLVKWESSDGEVELGIVLELDEPNAFDPVDRVLVYFINDNDNSLISTDDLEVLCK
jgi:hypothetical protein|tara:strand:- start:8027 stop:8206 length:180 start_codon:yes stop_codon:yes gene_type:complete